MQTGSAKVGFVLRNYAIEYKGESARKSNYVIVLRKFYLVYGFH